MSLKEEFYGEEWQKEAREVRKDTLKDGADRLLWKLLGKSARRVPVFRMSMAYSIFMEMLDEKPEGAKCLLHIEALRRGYLIYLVLLDEENEPVMKTTKACCARSIRAEELDTSVEQFMGEKEDRIMDRPVFQ